MKALILLATAAIALPFLIAGMSQGNRAVAERFLERAFLKPPTIPPDDTEPRKADEPPKVVNAGSLLAWVTKKPEAAQAYAWHVMPLDFVYLAVLGGFLALAANALASGIAWPSALAKLPAWIWFIFPAAYVLADFVEDCLIVMMMSQPATISDRTINLLTAFRRAKIGANGLAIIQIFVLGLAGTIRN
jgi:hypothetical protein